MSFQNIIGNIKVKNILTKSLKKNTILHSYMFNGKEGIGKKMMAEEFAKKILCEDIVGECNNCKSCIEFSSKNHPDFSYIVPDGNTLKIEQIRNFQSKVIEKPIISRKKVYIIDIILVLISIVLFNVFKSLLK